MTLKGHLVKSLVVPTHAERGFKTSYSQIVHLIERLIKLAGGKENVAGVGVCAPGPLNPKRVSLSTLRTSRAGAISSSRVCSKAISISLPTWKTTPMLLGLQRSFLGRRWDIGTSSM